MRGWALSLLAGLAWTLAACASPMPAGPALWRIADSDSEIWLFGSVHVLPPALQWRTTRIDAAFAGADELVLETDASENGGRAFADLAARLGTLPAGETLSSKLTPALRTRLAQVAASAHVDPASLEGLRPWLAALRLSLTYAAVQGQDPNSGVEPLLFAEARTQHKRFSFFETPEQQIRTLSDLPPSDEIKFFDATLNDIEHDTGAIDAADEAWVRGDTHALAALLGPELHEAGAETYAALMTRRNARWADEIQHRLQGSGDIFIVVGAGHLVGPDSVVALLRARGIKVEGP